MGLPFNKNALAQQRKFIIKHLLPDTCTIQPAGVMASVNVYGDPVMTTPALRQYQGSPLIPCRFEIARAFRPDQLKEQVITIDEYTVTLPFDMPVETDDVINDAAGNLYKTKRLSDASEWDAYKEILVTRVSFNDE